MDSGKDFTLWRTWCIYQIHASFHASGYEGRVGEDVCLPGVLTERSPFVNGAKLGRCTT